MIQDQIVFCVARNVPMMMILGMGFDEFGSLHESVVRLEAQDKIETAWTAMIAAQGTHKVMTDWLEPSNRLLSRSGKKSLSEFVAKHGKGIK